MNHRVWYSGAMSSIEDVATKFNQLSFSEAGSFCQDDAGVAVAMMTALLVAVLNRGAEISFVEKVLGLWGRLYILPIRAARLGDKSAASDPQKELGNLNAEMDVINEYAVRLSLACRNHNDREILSEEAAMEAVRAGFLRLVSLHNLLVSPERELDLAKDLRIS